MTKRIFHFEYLNRIANEGMTVLADDLIAAGWLVEAGYAKAEDDYEGPRITLTKAGQKLLEKKLRNNSQGRVKK